MWLCGLRLKEVTGSGLEQQSFTWRLQWLCCSQLQGYTAIRVCIVMWGFGWSGWINQENRWIKRIWFIEGGILATLVGWVGTDQVTGKRTLKVSSLLTCVSVGGHTTTDSAVPPHSPRSCAPYLATLVPTPGQ